MKIIPGVLVLVLGGVIACSSHGNKATGPVAGQDAAVPSGGDTVGAAGTGGSSTLGTGGTIVDTGGSGGKTGPESSTAAGAGGATVDSGSAGKGGTGGLTSTGGGTSAPDAGTGKNDAAPGPAVCGDGVLSVGETCDDGNLVPFDGCSPLCRVEPACTGSGCTSKCGDGLVVGEDCDDGNTADGDGCSSACKVETGWTCAQPPLGDKMMIPAVFRDFRYYKPTDFQPKVLGTNVASPGMVENALDAEGKPVYTGLAGSAVKVESASSFAQWYRDTPGINHTTTTPIALWKTADGIFVNRYGPNGEQWNATELAYFCGYLGQEKLDAEGKPIPCTTKDEAISTDCAPRNAKGMEMLKCSLSSDGKYYQGTYIITKLDGTPLWFPVDGDTVITPKSEFESATISPLFETGDEENKRGTWPRDVDASGNKVLHNFSFTSEIRSWFKYDAAKALVLEFVGDEDIWVFINKRLAVDLGGIHMPVKGSVKLDAATASKLGLVDGQVYEIAIFQAERQSDGSALKITVPGFNTAASACTRK